MALVVFVKGINVGGHRTFRPSVLAKQLARYGVVNFGAAGTFLVRKAVSRTKLRSEIMRRLPFEAEVMICGGNEISQIAGRNPFINQPSGAAFIHFIGILGKRRSSWPRIPLHIPRDGEWGVRVLVCRSRFVLGIYRRQMKAIGYLGQLERIFGAPVTIRNWNTVLAIARTLKE